MALTPDVARHVPVRESGQRQVVRWHAAEASKAVVAPALRPHEYVVERKPSPTPFSHMLPFSGASLASVVDIEVVNGSVCWAWTFHDGVTKVHSMIDQTADEFRPLGE